MGVQASAAQSYSYIMLLMQMGVYASILSAPFRPARLTLLLLVAEIVVLVLAFDRLRQRRQPAQGIG